MSTEIRRDDLPTEGFVRLRAAIDAVERVVAEFKAVYRRVEQYLAERQEKLENDIERNRKGRGR